MTSTFRPRPLSTRLRTIHASALLTALLALAVMVVAPPAAVAAAPPKGKYDCRFYDGGTFGLLKINSAKKYTWNAGKRGRYSTNKRRIRFRRGPLKGVYRKAEWRRNGKTIWINLFDEAEYGRSYTDAQCTRRRSS